MSTVVEFKKKVFHFKYEGETFKVSYPTVKRSMEFGKGFIEAEDKSNFVLDFLEEHGLEKEKALNSLQDDHIMEIVQYITGRKKK